MKSYKDQRGSTILMAVVAVVILAGLYLVFIQSQKVDNNQSVDQMMDQEKEGVMENDDQDSIMKDDSDEQMMKNEEDSMMKDDQQSSAGSYLDYSLAAYNAASDQKRVLFFHATWCPTCKAANIEISSNLDQIPAGVVILKTDYDTEVALKKKYNITYQHTFVEVDAYGEVITQWNGGGIDEIKSKVL